MAAYLIARVDVTDPDQYEEYKKLSPGAMAAFGGKFIVRGGQTETLEGDSETRRVVVVEFPDLESAKAAYNSDAYTHARSVREGAANMQMVVVDGA